MICIYILLQKFSDVNTTILGFVIEYCRGGSMDIFKTHGIKQTKNRVTIYEKLSKMNVPVSAENLYAQLLEDHTINLATVYRNLNIFEDKGIVEKHVRKDGISYFNVLRHQHNHYMICEVCKNQFELSECPIDKKFFDEQTKSGFKVTGHNVEIYGICKDCQSDKN